MASRPKATSSSAALRRAERLLSVCRGALPAADETAAEFKSPVGAAAGMGIGPIAPPDVQTTNYRRVQLDSVFIGVVVNASSTFLPVFLLRMGASGNDVALLTSLPALTALGLSIPFGRALQRRRNIVPWYSGLRLVAWMSYAVIAAVAALLPRDQSIPVMLAVWGLASLPSTAALTVFPIVMDGAAGPGGRFDLLGRRWAVASVTGAVAVAIGGQFLVLVPFPLNFEILLVVGSLAGVASFTQSRRIVIPDQAPVRLPATRIRVPDSLRGLWRLIASNRGFVRFEVRALAYRSSLGLALPILPLFYVYEVAASDAWIGIIGSATSLGSVVGYLTARQFANRQDGARLLLPAIVGTALCPAILFLVDWLPAVAGMAFLTGAAAAVAQLALFDALMRTIPTADGVTFSSVDQSVQNFGLVISPSVGGLLAVAIGPRNSLLAVVAVAMLAFAMFAADKRRDSGRATARTSSAGGPLPAHADGSTAE